MTCTALSIPSPASHLTVNPANAGTATTAVGSDVTFVCADGYELLGAPKLGCDSAGTWEPSSAVPTCIPAKCGNLAPLPNGVVTFTKFNDPNFIPILFEYMDALNGDRVVATHSCSSGFTLKWTPAGGIATGALIQQTTQTCTEASSSSAAWSIIGGGAAATGVLSCAAITCASFEPS